LQPTASSRPWSRCARGGDDQRRPSTGDHFGSVVIARVENGLDLLGLSGDFKSIAARLMLFLAVSFDMRRRRGSLM
jgi:ABC-type xylose transport system permease subunit